MAGKTYDSECGLTLTSCREARHVSLAYKGTCGKGTLNFCKVI